MRVNARRRGRGFLAADALLALAILIVLTAALVQTEGMQSRAERALNDRRTASRVLEARAMALQAGVPAPALPPGAVVRLRPLGGGETAPGESWVEFACDYRGQRVALTALLGTATLSSQTALESGIAGLSVRPPQETAEARP